MTTDPDPSTTLPGTHRRYGCSVEDYRLVLDTAIPELVRSGLAAETRDIAVGAGVSPTTRCCATPRCSTTKHCATPSA